MRQTEKETDRGKERNKSLTDRKRHRFRKYKVRNTRQKKTDTGTERKTRQTEKDRRTERKRQTEFFLKANGEKDKTDR